jgi:thiol-disulfide isomerase/thioredoxin
MTRSVSEMLRNIDVFQAVPREMAHVGGADWRGRIVFMLVGYAVVAILSVTEILSFTSSTWTTDAVVSSQMDDLISLQFVVKVPNVPCRYLKLGARDAFVGFHDMNTDANVVHLHPLDQDGNHKTAGKRISGGMNLALWAHPGWKVNVGKGTHAPKIDEERLTSDLFIRKNFSEVTSSNDFTFVYFHAGWCQHSRAFDPIWDEVVAQANENAQGQQVAFLKLNCEDFRDTCRDLNIRSFPTLRMYQRNGALVSFNGHRSLGGITGFLDDYFKGKVQEEPADIGGCRAQGILNIPRVQGSFHLTAGLSHADSPNPDLVNMSVTVEHLSFNAATAKLRTVDRMSGLKAEHVPSSVLEHFMPMDGKEFIAERADDVPEHFLKVVHTKIGSKKEFYQITHSARTGRSIDTTARTIPMARFTYDFSPLSVVLKKQSKPWYDFLTSFVAIIGGSYAVVQMFGGTLDKIHLAYKVPSKCS